MMPLVWYIMVSMLELYMDLLEPRVLEHTRRTFACNNYYSYVRRKMAPGIPSWVSANRGEHTR